MSGAFFVQDQDVQTTGFLACGRATRRKTCHRHVFLDGAFKSCPWAPKSKRRHPKDGAFLIWYARQDFSPAGEPRAGKHATGMFSWTALSNPVHGLLNQKGAIQKMVPF
ncbi:MAG: hypothetical protein ACI4PD_00560 [Butyricicoccus sp.]